MFADVNEAVSELSRELLNEDIQDSRNGKVKEILGNVTKIRNPRNKFVLLPGRNNNPFASVAETMWVLSGRNDLEFLSKYLPRAKDFSDDGLTWRAGYGPRLRNFHGVDQLMEVYHILKEDPSSRRAVISIFDPSADFVESKDIPCNNWLNFQIRDGVLHMMVSVRSNDLIWGFSGINSFEWAVLHEMLADWLNVEVGTQTWLQGSLHCYEPHWGRLETLADADATFYPRFGKCYSYATYYPSPDELEDSFEKFFEREAFDAPTVTDDIDLENSVFDQFTFFLQTYNYLKGKNVTTSLIKDIFSPLPRDMQEAALMYYRWTKKVD